MNKHSKRILHFLIITFFCAPCFADEYIRNVYIEASGNNISEAKIKANDIGMKRSVSILADKMGVKDLDASTASYDSLLSIFAISDPRHEEYENEWYGATVDYKFNRYKLDDLILKLGGQKAQKASYGVLLIPVFKRQNQISMWDKDVLWNSVWDKIFQNIPTQKVLYPKGPSKARSVVNANNVFKMSYNDFLALFPSQLIQSMAILVAEYFTSEDGREYLQIEKIEHRLDTVKKTYKRYPVNDLAGFNIAIKTAAYEFLASAGLELPRKMEGNVAVVDYSILERNASRYVLYFENFGDEISKIKSKLSSIQQLASLSVDREKENIYKITIDTTLSLEELTKHLYMVGLTYIENDGKYKIMEKSSGI